MSQLRLLDVEAGLPSTDGLAQRAAEFCETDAAPFSTTPDKVAELIVAGLAKGKEESCIISQSACWACWRSVFGISTSW